MWLATSPWFAWNVANLSHINFSKWDAKFPELCAIEERLHSQIRPERSILKWSMVSKLSEINLVCMEDRTNQVHTFFFQVFFGLVLAPSIFIKLIKIPVVLLTKLTILILIYLDNFVNVDWAREETLIALDNVILLLQHLGVLLNLEKLILEQTPQIQFINSVNMIFSLKKWISNWRVTSFNLRAVSYYLKQDLQITFLRMIWELRLTARVTSYFLHTSYELLLIAWFRSSFLRTSSKLLSTARIIC